ncbi:MAG: hypothetical protein ACLQVD_21560 [Capsulimonadaceae bacterium]
MAIAVWVDNEPALPGALTFEYRGDPNPGAMITRIRMSGEEKDEFARRLEQSFRPPLTDGVPGDLAGRVFEVLYLFLLTRRGRRDPIYVMTKLKSISFEADCYEFTLEAVSQSRSRDGDPHLVEPQTGPEPDDPS